VTGAAEWGESTRAVHLPPPPVPEQTSLGLPVWRTAAFAFSGPEEFAELLAGTRPGYSYSRIANPTTDAFAAGVAALEGHGVPGEVAGETFASGMGAISAIVFALCRSGSHVVGSREVYGGTYGLLSHVLTRFGVSVDLVDTGDPAVVRSAVRAETVLIYAETLANPTMSVADLPALAEVAHEAGLPLVVDSTFATPVVCRPLAHGADLVVHSATKYLGGHGDVTGGVVAGRAELVRRVAAMRTELGAALSPDDGFLLHRGLATLPLRMERHCASALAFAEATGTHPRVRRVDYPGLSTHRDHALATKLFNPGRFGGVVTVTVEGGRAGAAALCQRLRLAVVASSLGSHRTKVSPVATTTHRQLDDAALAAARINPGAVRFSIGLEDPEDIVDDVLKALDGLDEG
jgi:cystathionine beta-lyase/cystathionine gamma-synthase